MTGSNYSCADGIVHRSSEGIPCGSHVRRSSLLGGLDAYFDLLPHTSLGSLIRDIGLINMSNDHVPGTSLQGDVCPGLSSLAIVD